METESPMEATGSQNRDEHPIPKEIVTPTIPYSQLLAREEEDEILGLGTTATPSPTTPDKVQQLKAEIVEHVISNDECFTRFNSIRIRWVLDECTTLWGEPE